MPKSRNRAIPVNVVDNPSASAMPGTPVMSGGLGGTVTPNSKDVPDSEPRAGRRSLTFMHALRRECSVRKNQIDLSGVYYSPFVRDVTESPRYYLRDESQIVDDIENAMLSAAVEGRNKTPIGMGIGGGARRALFMAVKKVIREAKAGKINVIGINANPAGNQAGRPGTGVRS